MEDMGMNKGFWREKRVFLTGHSGFKGAWLSLWLKQLGADLTGYSLRPPTSPNLFELAKVEQGMCSLIGDIRDDRAVSEAMRNAKPEIVIHMAAQPLVRYSYQQPVETYTTNVMGTVHVLEAVRQTDSVRALLNITSDKCYENREWSKGYLETDAMGGFDPYSSSKGCAELVTAAYRNSYFHPQRYGKHRVAVATARAGNVIGGGDWAQDRLIPDIVKALAADTPINIRHPNAIRPWQHVLEPLYGYLLLAQRLYEEGASFAEAWNFGPEDDDAKPVWRIAERLIQCWGNGAAWRLDTQADQPHEAHQLKLDCSKAKEKLKWAPHWSLDEALDAVVRWYRDYFAGKDMRDVTSNQIAEFELRVRKAEKQHSASMGVAMDRAKSIRGLG
ncbi:MAG: CDP-glucose 4,6-dehydratase [Gammaproteobacteria bacterium]